MAPAQPDTLLIVPGGYGDGPAHRAQASAAGARVLGASSVTDDPAAALFDDWTYLPHISDPGFEAALAEIVARHGVSRIHATHYALWFHLEKALPRLAPEVTLTLGRSNFDLEADYRELKRRVAAAPEIGELAGASTPRPPPSAVETAGLIRAAMAIPGESYEAKLFPLIEAMRRAPQGDIVEVGSLFGRTAAFLALLSHRFGLGCVLTVDPWAPISTEQGNDTLKAASQAYDWEAWRGIYEINVAPFAQGRLNYIHAPSVEGHAVYAAGREITTGAFGTTRYEGSIALLHIDANHEFAYVQADAEAWIPHVKPGGWIVFDDYQWDWGDGVQRVADAFVADNAGRVRTRFVAGGAMFIQLQA